MKYLLLVASFSLVLCASEEETNESSKPSTSVYSSVSEYWGSLTAISLPNSKVSNSNFVNIINAAQKAISVDASGNSIDQSITRYQNNLKPHTALQKLNVANNKFTDAFPLERCLQLFPNLTELTINNNNVTQLAKYDANYHNSSLKTYSARNTQCAGVNIGWFYRTLNLSTLDLSDSSQLRNLSGFERLYNKGDDVTPPQVIVKNSAITKRAINRYKEQALVCGKTKTIIIANAGYAAVTCGLVMMLILVPADHTTTVSAGLTYHAFPAFVAGFVGRYLGDLYACYTLPNYGNTQVIKFVTE